MNDNAEMIAEIRGMFSLGDTMYFKHSLLETLDLVVQIGEHLGREQAIFDFEKLADHIDEDGDFSTNMRRVENYVDTVFEHEMRDMPIETRRLKLSWFSDLHGKLAVLDGATGLQLNSDEGFQAATDGYWDEVAKLVRELPDMEEVPDRRMA